jgi:uncharacterized membrane protein
VAGICHVLYFLGFQGLAAAGIIWVTQRKRSKFLRLHGLQALAWGFLTQVAGLIMLALVAAAIWPGMVSLVGDQGGAEHETVLPVAASDILWTGPGILILLGGILGIAVCMWTYRAARAAFRGEVYYYPLIGLRVRKFLFGK